MDEIKSKLTDILKNTEEIKLKDFNMEAENIGLEIQSGGGVPPQLPIRIFFNNRMFSGYINKQLLRKNK